MVENRISWAVLERVEETYSKGRLDALLDEWRDNCPGLSVFLTLLRNGPIKFPLNWWSDSDIMELVSDARIANQGWCANICQQYSTYETTMLSPNSKARNNILQLFYEVCITGVQLNHGGRFQFSHIDYPVLLDFELEKSPDIQIEIHPCFRSALGTRTI